MRLWIGIHLPLLPLETFRPRWSEPGPHVVIERARVMAMSAQAAQAGVRIGMRRGGVSAIAPAATMHERDPAREHESLQGIALALLQYTPEVAAAGESALLLDVTASLRAFGGRLALCRRVRACVAELGFTLRLGMAPTATAAWLLARHEPGPRPAAGEQARRAVRMETMVNRLDRLPFALLPAAAAHADWLDGIGCRTLGDLRRLPRAGLARRAGAQALEQLDRAYGAAPEAFEWIEAPPTFSAALELPDRIEHAEAALFAARRLLLRMTGWLVARQMGVSRFVLLMEHERGRAAMPPSALEIVLAEAAWKEDHLARLLRERLARMRLEAPVIALRLEAMQLSPMAPASESLFPEPGGTPADYHRLLELLTARLGADSVLAPAPEEDYRPEICNRWLPATQPPPRAVATMGDGGERPFWLLEKPMPLLTREHRPFYGSPLKLISGPERIECGWWDSAFAMRDYFIAQDDNAACYWIYRERCGDEMRWFLHGLFA